MCREEVGPSVELRPDLNNVEHLLLRQQVATDSVGPLIGDPLFSVLDLLYCNMFGRIVESANVGCCSCAKYHRFTVLSV